MILSALKDLPRFGSSITGDKPPSAEELPAYALPLQTPESVITSAIPTLVEPPVSPGLTGDLATQDDSPTPAVNVPKMMREMSVYIREYTQQLSKQAGKPVEPSAINQNPEGLKQFILEKEKARFSEAKDKESQLQKTRTEIKTLEVDREKTLKAIADGSSTPIAGKAPLGGDFEAFLLSVGQGKEPPEKKAQAFPQKQLETCARIDRVVETTRFTVDILDKELQKRLKEGEPPDSEEIKELKDLLEDNRQSLSLAETQQREFREKLPAESRDEFLRSAERYRKTEDRFDTQICSKQFQEEDLSKELAPIREFQAFLNNCFDFKNHPNRRIVLIQTEPGGPYAANLIEFNAKNPDKPIELPEGQILTLTLPEDGDSVQKALNRMIPGATATVIKELPAS